MSQPKVRATVHRFGIGVKPSGPRGAGGDFHVDAEGGGVLDEVLAVASIDPDRVDGGVVGSDLVEQAGAGDGVLDAGRGDEHGEQEAERVGHNAALRAHDLLGWSVP